MIMFLRTKVQMCADWLFNTPTRALEVTSGLIGLFFSIVMLADYHVLVGLKTYEPFAYVRLKWGWLLLALLAIIQLYKTVDASINGKEKSAYLLLWFALAYAIISVLFAASYPPLSTGFSTYIILSVINTMGYMHIDNEVKATKKTSKENTRND